VIPGHAGIQGVCRTRCGERSLFVGPRRPGRTGGCGVRLLSLKGDRGWTFWLLILVAVYAALDMYWALVFLTWLLETGLETLNQRRFILNQASSCPCSPWQCVRRKRLTRRHRDHREVLEGVDVFPLYYRSLKTCASCKDFLPTGD
jgi:hypothetical protein